MEIKRKPGRPKKKTSVMLKKSKEDVGLLKELQKMNTLLNDIRLILDNMWRERRP